MNEVPMDLRLSPRQHYDLGMAALETGRESEDAQRYALTACAQAALGILKLLMEAER